MDTADVQFTGFAVDGGLEFYWNGNDNVWVLSTSNGALHIEQGEIEGVLCLFDKAREVEALGL